MSGSVSGRSGHAASQCRQGVQSVAEVLRQLQLRLQPSLECRSDGYYCCQHRTRGRTSARVRGVGAHVRVRSAPGEAVHAVGQDFGAKRHLVHT